MAADVAQQANAIRLRSLNAQADGVGTSDNGGAITAIVDDPVTEVDGDDGDGEDVTMRHQCATEHMTDDDAKAFNDLLDARDAALDEVERNLIYLALLYSQSPSSLWGGAQQMVEIPGARSRPNTFPLPHLASDDSFAFKQAYRSLDPHLPMQTFTLSTVVPDMEAIAKKMKPVAQAAVPATPTPTHQSVKSSVSGGGFAGEVGGLKDGIVASRSAPLGHGVSTPLLSPSHDVRKSHKPKMYDPFVCVCDTWVTSSWWVTDVACLL